MVFPNDSTIHATVGVPLDNYAFSDLEPKQLNFLGLAIFGAFVHRKKR